MTFATLNRGSLYQGTISVVPGGSRETVVRASLHSL
jgi:hypothetical protein